MSRNYHQPSNHQFSAFSNMMVPTSYQKYESLYPEMAMAANEMVCAGQKRTVYNLNPTVQIQPPVDNQYFVYEQENESSSTTTTLVDKDSTQYIESILRKNKEVWNHYSSGKFDVLSCLEDKCKRIILKEKVANHKLTDTNGFEITKYRVRISNHHQKSKKSDEILLVSYENSAKILSRAKSFSRTVSQSKFVHCEPSLRSSSCSSFESTGGYVCDVAGVAGPGSELIAKLIEGEDEDLIVQCKPVEEQRVESEEVGQDLVGNYYLDSNDDQKEEPAVEEQSENFNEEEAELDEEQQVPEETYDDSQERNGDSFDEEYIEHFAPSDYSSSRKSISRQESNGSGRKNDRLTGSVKKALHIFKEYENASNNSGTKTASKTYTKTSKSSRSSEHEVEVYTLSPLQSPVDTRKPRSAKSETPTSLASSKLTQVSSRNSVSNRLFNNTSSTVTPAPPNPFAFGNNSPMSQSRYADALTGVTSERQTPIYAESRASKNSKQSKSSSYRRLNGALREEEEDEKTFTG
ncbi:hypothetical protein BpHYR1_049793, partial [Brachionus plicatilis]